MEGRRPRGAGLDPAGAGPPAVRQGHGDPGDGQRRARTGGRRRVALAALASLVRDGRLRTSHAGRLYAVAKAGADDPVEKTALAQRSTVREALAALAGISDEGVGRLSAPLRSRLRTPEGPRSSRSAAGGGRARWSRR
ncbi:hypothetical protein GCM10010466_30340 [Planomonospora alba]|uniref:Uncharacterized protein n=1 Tax=Planomonospora alba TaxID=161354 RepID=A0ABP6N5Q4_9ACTN